jgi:hypothetical protein
MLSAAITYQVLQQESLQSIEKVKAVLEKTSLVCEPMAGEVPAGDPGVVLFLQGARRPNELRTTAPQYHRDRGIAF